MRPSPSALRPYSRVCRASRALLPGLAALVTAGCVQTSPPGPDLGPCADVPDGIYTFGEASIGTCLSAPTDLRFWVDGARTWMLLSNADPFRLFQSGSFLVLDADAAGAALRAGVSRQLVDELAVGALPLEPFAGRIGLDPVSRRAVVPSRFSPDSFTTGALDRVSLIDLADPAAPAFVAGQASLAVTQDPFAVEVDDQGRAWVVNATDHSISIIDLRAPRPALLDPRPEPLFAPGDFDDVDGSGSVAVVRGTPDALDPLLQDVWTATFTRGATRAWLPADPSAPDAGLQRYARAWNPASARLEWSLAGVAPELDPADVSVISAVRAPWFTRTSNLAVMFFEADDGIRSAVTEGSATAWSFTSGRALAPGVDWSEVVGAPGIASVNDRSIMLFAGRTADGSASAIGLALTSDGVTYTARSTPVIAVEGALLDHPAPLSDPQRRVLRAWFTLTDDSGPHIAHAESADGGVTWTTPERIVTGGAAPVVRWAQGLYRMWFVSAVGPTWSLFEASSVDGLNWTPADAGLDTGVPVSAPPPRAAIQDEPQPAWRLEGRDLAAQDDPVLEGVLDVREGLGFSLRVASGYAADVSRPDDLGLRPGAVAELPTGRTLFATADDATGRPRLVALRRAGRGWGVIADDLVPAGTGGNTAGVGFPVVYEASGLWHMVYTAYQTAPRAADGTPGEGRAVLRRATSADGLLWEPQPGALLDGDARPGWEGIAQEPGSVEVLGDGTLQLWYAGFDGARRRIGAARSTDGVTWTRRVGTADAWVFGPGEPGGFDDAGVWAPAVRRSDDGSAVLLYTADDGTTVTLGLATRASDGAPFVRRVAPNLGVPAAVVEPLALSAWRGGVDNPTWVTATQALFGGLDGGVDDGIVRAFSLLVDGTEVYTAPRQATPGDTLHFTTLRGVDRRATVDLGQIVGALALPGASGNLADDGPTASAYDADRGFLFLASPVSSAVLVVDVRDDSDGLFDDTNAFDLEAVIRLDDGASTLGVLGLTLGAGGQLHLTTRGPDTVMTVDTLPVADNASKELLADLVLGSLPLKDLTDDAGAPTFASRSGGTPAVVPGQDLLLVPHFRDNALSIIDLRRGSVGEEVRYLRDLPENPHLVRVAPDGTWAVVVSFLGDVEGSDVGSAMTLLDLDPTSPTYLDAVTRIVNR